jgi:8-hydroxy-5-deazaflavin:NADPH oxidoreductase
MRIGILGTGIVGRTIGTRLVGAGHAVCMGSRTADNARAAEWLAGASWGASIGTFADAARHGDVAFNCTAGAASLEALEMAGSDNLRGKILIDVANPLDFSRGMPPSLTVCNDDSLAEQIQRAYPETRVVKALSTMNCAVMVEPSLVPGDHNVFLSGEDGQAKAQVADWLGAWFGWPRGNIIDLGGIETARGVEMILPLWLRIMGKLQSGRFNFHVVKGRAR